MYLYTICHASFERGLLNYDCPDASKKSLIRWCMRIFFLSVLLTFNLMLLGKDSNSQDLDKVIISLNVKDVTLKQVFNKIEKQTSFHFTYRSDDVRRIKAITYTQDKVTLAKALNDLLQNTGLRYEEMDKNILIMQTDNPIAAVIENIQADTAILRGKVTNESGEPLAGATITIEGQNKSVITNSEGEFRIANTRPGKYKVTVTYVGYQPISRDVIVSDAGATDLALSLQKLASNMEEVVVIGYGTKKRQYLTGAVSTVTSEVLQSRPITATLAGLQGEIPGLVVQRSSGQPGTEGFDLNVRGVSSTNGGNSPLVLIDGIAGGNLDLLNPDDIESVAILKDASASIYGARAAGGVMIVTTKKGKKGTPRINVTSNAGITKMSGMMESPTNYQMALMDNEANIHAGAAPMYTPDLLEKIRNNDPNPIDHPVYASSGWKLFFTNTDWIKAVIENGFQQKHNVSISGGGNNSTYFLSGGYINQQGVIKYAKDNNERYNLRLNYDYDFSKHIRFESNISMENQVRSDIGGLGSYGGSQPWVIIEAIFGMPNHPVYTPEGKFFAQGGWGNAVAQAKESVPSKFVTRNLNTNFKVIADVFKGLKLNLQAGISYRSDNDKDVAKSIPLYNWDEQITYYTVANPGESSLWQYNSENTYRNFTGYLQYNKKFAGKHDLEIMAGASHEENDFDWFEARRRGFISEELWSLNLGSTDNMTNTGGGNQWAIGSYFSRLSYVYNNKYMLETNLRYDGSSRFDPDNRWGLFPGVSLGWRLSQENFMKDLRFFNDLKLRVSYGETGNQELNEPGNPHLYDYLQSINIGGSYPFGAGGQVPSASLAGIAAPDRTWETLVSENIGIDATMLSSRLNFTFDYFIKRNKDMLIKVAYPSMLGAIAPFSNSGELKTWGFETSIGWKGKVGRLDYSARAILSDSKNKIVNYGGQDTYVTGLNYIREGYPVNTYFAYEFDGLIRDQKQLDEYKKLGGVPSDIGIGDAKFKDINGDGKISTYTDNPGQDGDVVNVGNISPRYTFGVNLGAKYRNFDLSVFIQGVGNKTLFRVGDYSIPWTDWWRQPPAFYFGKTWNEDRPDAKYPRLSHGNIRWWNYQPSTLQKINAAYARLKNLQVGYSLPAGVTKRLTISNARIYFSGENLWEVHNVKGGWDPESGESGFNYPFQRFYSFGIDITF